MARVTSHPDRRSLRDSAAIETREGYPVADKKAVVVAFAGRHCAPSIWIMSRSAVALCRCARCFWFGVPSATTTFDAGGQHGSVFGPHDRGQTGVAVEALDELSALVANERVGAVVTPENPFRGVAPRTVHAAGTGAGRPGRCLPAALRATPCRGVGRQFVGRTVVRGLS